MTDQKYPLGNVRHSYAYIPLLLLGSLLLGQTLFHLPMITDHRGLLNGALMVSATVFVIGLAGSWSICKVMRHWAAERLTVVILMTACIALVIGPIKEILWVTTIFGAIAGTGLIIAFCWWIYLTDVTASSSE